jgi:MFS family permease
MSIFLRSLGADYVEIGLLSSISSFISMLFSVPSGYFIDRVKRLKRIYIIGSLLTLPVTFITAFVQSWHVFIGLRVWQTMLSRITMPIMNIININSYSNEDRVVGLAFTRTLSAAVGLFSPLIMAYIIDYYGGLGLAPESLRGVFLIQFAVGLLTFLLLYWKLEEPEFERAPSKPGVISNMTGIFKEVPGLYRLLLLNVTNMFFMQIRMPFIQLYFYEVKNATAFIIGWQGTIQTAVSLFLSIPLSRLADKFGRRRTAYVGRVVTSICVLSAILTPPDRPEFLLVYSFLSAIGTALEIGWHAFQQEYIPLDIRGRWSGISSLVTALVTIPAPIIGGYLWEQNPEITWWIGVAHYLLISLPLMMSIKERKQPSEIADE